MKKITTNNVELNIRNSNFKNLLKFFVNSLKTNSSSLNIYSIDLSWNQPEHASNLAYFIKALKYFMDIDLNLHLSPYILCRCSLSFLHASAMWSEFEGIFLPHFLDIIWDMRISQSSTCMCIILRHSVAAAAATINEYKFKLNMKSMKCDEK